MQKRWLFVTYSPDPKRPYMDGPARYRCFDRVEDLRAEGREAAVISQQRFMRHPPLDYDIYVFHRPWYTQDFEGLLAYLNRRGKRLIADYDAPIFAAPWRGPVDPPFPELPAGETPAQGRFDSALGLFATVLAATPELAEMILGRYPRTEVHVIESGLGSSWREMADSLYRYPPGERREVCVGAGSEMELDVELLRRVLPAAMRNRRNLRLILDPRLGLRAELPPKRVTERPYEAGCCEILGHSHTLFLPAASGPWNDAASGVRLLEAAYLGCRVIAAPLPCVLRHRDSGIQIAETDKDWEELLEKAEAERDESTLIYRCEYALKNGVSFHQTRRMIQACES